MKIVSKTLSTVLLLIAGAAFLFISLNLPPLFLYYVGVIDEFPGKSIYNNPSNTITRWWDGIKWPEGDFCLILLPIIGVSIIIIVVSIISLLIYLSQLK